jgi:hypothetical protein
MKLYINNKLTSAKTLFPKSVAATGLLRHFHGMALPRRMGIVPIGSDVGCIDNKEDDL